MHGRTKRWFEFLICQYLIWQATCLFDTYLRRWCKNSSYQATENSKELLYLSDGAALTRGHRLDGWNHRNAFMVLETGSLRSGCQRGWVLVRTVFLASRFLPSHCMLNRGRESPRSFMSLVRALISSGGLVTSSKHSYPGRHPSLNTITLEVTI